MNWVTVSFLLVVGGLPLLATLLTGEAYWIVPAFCLGIGFVGAVVLKFFGIFAEDSDSHMAPLTGLLSVLSSLMGIVVYGLLLSALFYPGEAASVDTVNEFIAAYASPSARPLTPGAFALVIGCPGAWLLLRAVKEYQDLRKDIAIIKAEVMGKE